MTTEFGEEIVIKNNFLRVVGGECGRSRAGSILSVWKLVCGAMCWEQNVDVLRPLVQEEFVGSPATQFLEETEIVEAPVLTFLDETLEVVR